MVEGSHPIILVLNGPNLNLLGTREPEVYGRDSLADIEQMCRQRAQQLGFAIDFQQWNGEGEMVTAIQDARGPNANGQGGKSPAAGIIINPAGYSHTSVALRDAVLAVGIPTIEVHLSNPHKREEFRHFSYISGAAAGVICGLGSFGYVLALEALARILGPAEQPNS